MSTKPTYEALEKQIAELKQRADECQAEAQKYRTLFNSFPHGISVSDENGNIIETNAMAEKLLSVEESLGESEERFEKIYTHMSVGVAQISMDFLIEHANEAYCQMLGYNEEELIGKHLKEITHPEVVMENLEKQSRLASGEIDHYRMDKKFIHKNGHVIHGILDANLVRDADGKPLYFLGSVLDINALINEDEIKSMGIDRYALKPLEIRKIAQILQEILQKNYGTLVP